MPNMMKRAKEIIFRLRRVVEKPRKEYRKRGSKYDPIIDQFIEGEHDLVEVEVENRDANYMRQILVALVKARGLEDRVKASVAEGVLYLEKV